MSTSGKIGMRGVRSSGNELTAQPGTVKVGDNVNLPTEGVMRPRRGQGPLYVSGGNAVTIDNDSANANANIAKAMYQWGTSLLVNYTGNAGYKLSSFSAPLTTTPGYANVGSYAPPAPTILRMKFAELAKSVYWTTDAGLATLDVVTTGTARTAGVRAPEGLETTGSARSGLSGDPNASGSWMATNTAVAIRACMGFKDANGVVHLSAPCGRLVLSNPADVTVAIGSLVRNSNVVTATVSSHTFMVGDIVNLTVSGGDSGNFDETNNVVTSVTATTIVWAETAANYTNVAQVTITSGTKYLVYTAILPPGMTTSHFVQFYRSDVVTGATSDPGDECFLVYERFLTSTDISNRYVSSTDRTPDGRQGAPLDSNANSGEGANGINLRPPLCRDICTWDGRLWGAQTTDPHRLPIRLLGTGTPDGLQSGDVLCLHTFALVAGTDFTLYTEFTPTLNVRRTLRSMTSGVNYSLNISTHVVRMLMDGDTDETWGKFSLEEDGVGGSTLYAGTTRTSAFAEALATVHAVTEASSSRLSNVVTITTATSHGFTTGDTIVLAANASAGEADFATGTKTVASTPSGTTFTYAENGINATMSGTPAYWVYKATFKSDNNQQPLRHSRAGIPEAWPLPFTPGGLPDGAEVLRIKPTPDAGELMVFLKSGDIYALSGQYPYNVRRVDGSATLVFADSLVEHANTLYGLTTQGPATISSSGVGIIGNDIDDEWRELLRGIETSANDKSAVFSVSYESDRQLHLWLPIVAGTTAGRCYVYHSANGQWTRWTSLNRTCGLVFRGADMLLMGGSADNRIIIERKHFGSDLFSAFGDGVFYTTANGNQSSVSTVQVATTTTALAAGDVVFIGSSFYRVTSATATAITIDGTVSVTNGDTVIYARSFTPTVTFTVEAAGVPGVEKQFRELQLHFGRRGFDNMTVTFSNEHSASSTATVTCSPTDFTLASPINAPSTIRMDIPQSMKAAALLTVSLSVSEALSFFDLLGYSISFEPISERTGR